MNINKRIKDNINSELIKVRRGKKTKSLPNETVDYSKIDARYLRRTGRTVQFATKVTPEFDQNIRQIAQQKGYLIVEVLEEIMDVYLKTTQTNQTSRERERERNQSKQKNSP